MKRKHVTVLVDPATENILAMYAMDGKVLRFFLLNTGMLSTSLSDVATTLASADRRGVSSPGQRTWTEVCADMLTCARGGMTPLNISFISTVSSRKAICIKKIVPAAV